MFVPEVQQKEKVHYCLYLECASQSTDDTHNAQNTGHFCFHALQPLLLNVSNILSHPCENWTTWVRIYPHVHLSHQTHHNQQDTFGTVYLCRFSTLWRTFSDSTIQGSRYWVSCEISGPSWWRLSFPHSVSIHPLLPDSCSCQDRTVSDALVLFYQQGSDGVKSERGRAAREL